jgi:hypothetical protein
MTRTDSTCPVATRRVALALTLLALACPALASGDQQPGTAPAASGKPGRPRSFEIAVGGEILTPQGLGSSTATLTSNSQTGTPYTYFVVNGTRAAAAAFRGRLGYNLTSILTVEGGVVISRGNVQGDVSADAEGVTATTLSDRMTQYFLDVSVLAHLRQMAFSSGAGVPFLEAGGGYLRQVHEGNLAIDTGQIYHVGGGVTYMFSRRPTSKLTGVGFRADARIYVPRKGYSFSGSQQVFAGVGGSLLVTF